MAACSLTEFAIMNKIVQLKFGEQQRHAIKELI
jgi:hypothetical protein